MQELNCTVLKQIAGGNCVGADCIYSSGLKDRLSYFDLQVASFTMSAGCAGHNEYSEINLFINDLLSNNKQLLTLSSVLEADGTSKAGKFTMQRGATCKLTIVFEPIS